MSLEDDDDAPPPDYYQFLPIGVAALLTAAAIGLCFFTFTVPAEKPASRPSVATDGGGEVMIGVGSGSTIHGPQGQPDPAKRP